MKIYTRGGDSGETGLLGGDRTTKASLRIEALGSLDELNAVIGFVLPICADAELGEQLVWIQRALFDAGAELSSPPGGKFAMADIGNDHTARLETSIDRYEQDLKPLKNFILPGGSELASRLHMARSVCRRAERDIARLHLDEPVRPELMAFLNRLADWLFVAARHANRLSGSEDVIWTSTKR